MQDCNVKVSVVVPIYNVEKYLKRCIDSIVNQTYTNLEIILIDDGSTDNSLDICKEYEKKDKRITVIHKKNEGLGLTRNRGIEQSKGKYICFIDSDDYFDSYAIEKCVYLAEKEKLDIVTFGMNKIDDYGKILETIIPKSKRVTYLEKEYIYKLFAILLGNDKVDFDGVSNIIGSAWASFYSLELIKKIKWKFVSERVYLSEDILSFLYLFSEINRMGIVNEPLYYYQNNLKSLTHTYNNKKIDLNDIFLEEGLKICYEKNYNKEIIDGYKKYYISNTIGLIKALLNSNLSKKEKDSEIKRIIYGNVLQDVLKEYNYDIECFKRKVLLHLIYLKRINLIRFLVNLKK